MKKIKFLILALLGLILIPTTNAYELGNQNFWSDSWVPSPTTRHKGMCLHYSRDWYMTFDGKTSSYSSISSNNTSCPEGAILGNFFSPKDYSSPWNEGIYNNYFSYVNSKKNGEGMDMIRTVYQNGEHKSIIYILPSRTAYKRTSKSGISYMFTQIYFYHNQFILYDPVKEFGLSFLGKMNIVGGAVFSNPSLTDDNLWFVDYIHKKAYSATITNTAAWKRLLGTDVSKERLQAVNWTKSYTINPGGSSFLPPRFKIDKQGGSGYQYIEDIEFVIPERGQGNSSNQNNVAENYNKCVNYYSDIKNLAYYSQKCGEDPADEETLNRVKVDSWNAETESQTVIDQLTGANRNKCGRFAKAKKQYKEKYGAEFEKFYKEFGKYARTPEALDVQSLCKGVELEHSAPPYIGYSSGNLSSWKDFFSSLFSGKGLKTWLDEEDEKIMYSSGNVVYTVGGYKTDLSQLEALYGQCYNKIYSESSEDVRIKTSYCNLYNSEKRRLSQKYASIDFASFGLVPFDARISQREAVANSGYLITYYNSVSSGFFSALSEVGSKLFGFVQTPFLAGFDHGKFLSCQDSFSVPQFEIFAYIFFALIVFYLLKYL